MDSSKTEPPSGTPIYRKPTLSDAPAVHALIDRCKPLDLNSPYAYLLLCTDFVETCAVAEIEGELAGFVSSYLKPEDPSVLFVWQVAVSQEARGHGVGKGLLRELLSRHVCARVQHLETTITPSNEASWKLFYSLASERGALCARHTAFHANDFGAHSHEEEHMLRISPVHERKAVKG